MSTDWRPIPCISFEKLFDGRLEKYGIKVANVDGGTNNYRYLKSCDGFLEVYRADDGTCRFNQRCCVPRVIFDAIAEEFEIEWVSEYDHRYWGFKKEWNDWHDKLNEKAEDDFYNDLVCFCRDEPSDIKPDTIGMIQAKIAKYLVEGDPGLTAPGKRDEMLRAVRAIYERGSSFIVNLAEEDLAESDLMSRTGDPPRS